MLHELLLLLLLLLRASRGGGCGRAKTSAGLPLAPAAPPVASLMAAPADFSTGAAAARGSEEKALRNLRDGRRLIKGVKGKLNVKPHQNTHAPMHPCTHAPMHPCTHAHPCTPMHPCTLEVFSLDCNIHTEEASHPAALRQPC